MHVDFCGDRPFGRGFDSRRLHHFSWENDRIRVVFPPPPLFLHGLPNRFRPASPTAGSPALSARRAQMHVPLRGPEILMAREFLDGPRRCATHRLTS